MSSLRQAWEEFLGQWDWQIYFTQTFENECKYARLAIDRVKRILEKFVVRYNLYELTAFIAAEQHISGAYHAHGLITSCHNLLKFDYSLKFLRLLGREKYGLCGYASIKSIGGVRGYVSKYITKALADYDIFVI